MIAPSDRDDQIYLTAVEAMVGMGVQVSKDAVLARLGIQEAVSYTHLTLPTNREV